MKTIQRLYKHLYWADKRILEGLQANGAGDGKMVQLFAHILQSEQVWLTRPQGRTATICPYGRKWGRPNARGWRNITGKGLQLISIR
ncbi:hypothetical protein LJK88_32485 [Paenibacillus sp. P26]|nr:hypothetical protein LJK88_32485 [Paenibacillus sp. P26]